MHEWILGVAASAVAGVTFASGDGAAGTTPCLRADAAVLERFISAECEACWTDASVVQPGANEWLLDWIVPSTRGDEAPLSSAAPAEARARVRRVLPAEPADDRASMHRSASRAARAAPQLRVAAGPAWNGYFGVQVDVSGRTTAGASVWTALVETVAIGTDGSAVPRQLVRAVAGPVSLESSGGQPWRHLQAMRWPETAKPTRLHARAWIEDAAGRIVAMAGEPCLAR